MSAEHAKSPASAKHAESAAQAGSAERPNGSPGLAGTVPLAPEDRVDQLVGPLALDELVLDQVRLTAHAVALHHPGGRPVAAVAPADDPVQAKVMEHNGMRREAHLVENEFVKGEWTDELIYAILRREWNGSGRPG